MSTYRSARVTDVTSWGEMVQLAQIEFDDGSRGSAVILEELVGTVERGDRIIANATAVELGLGSGGYHFAVWNLEADELETGGEGHIMKLRYTPMQLNARAVEEDLGLAYSGLSRSLQGMPVVAGSLHSQLLPVAIAFKKEKPEGRLVYVMTDGGSLPLKFSHTARFLKEEGYLQSTISCGHAFGGDYEAVNVHGALIAARRVCGADAAVVTMGPGIVGTGSSVGFSGMEQGTVLNAASSLGGIPIAIPRITFKDPRERHRGLSHHTVAVLMCGACVEVRVPLPEMEAERGERVERQLRDAGIDSVHRVHPIDAGPVLELIRECGFEPTVMGRSVDEEPEYFMSAGAAGLLAARTGGD